MALQLVCLLLCMGTSAGGEGSARKGFPGEAPGWASLGARPAVTANDTRALLIAVRTLLIDVCPPDPVSNPPLEESQLPG